MNKNIRIRMVKHSDSRVWLMLVLAISVHHVLGLLYGMRYGFRATLPRRCGVLIRFAGESNTTSGGTVESREVRPLRERE